MGMLRRCRQTCAEPSRAPPTNNKQVQCFCAELKADAHLGEGIDVDDVRSQSHAPVSTTVSPVSPPPSVFSRAPSLRPRANNQNAVQSD